MGKWLGKLRLLSASILLISAPFLYQNCGSASHTSTEENNALMCAVTVNKNLPRLSNWEYKQILQDTAPDVFNTSWNPGLPELAPVNGFDNRISTNIDKTTAEVYLDKAQIITEQILGSRSVMDACNQSLHFADRGWANCALPIAKELAYKFYRRPLRADEIALFSQQFQGVFSTVSSIVQTSSTPLRMYFDGVMTSGGNVYAYGWGYDPVWEDRNIELHFYIRPQGGTGSGTYIGATIANGSRPDVNDAFGIRGQHGFQFVIPSTYVNGVSYELFAYGIGAGNSLASNSPRTFSATNQQTAQSFNGSYRTEFREALSTVISSMLMSPHFLYKAEFIDGGFLADENQFEKAARLAFLTRSSFPDTTLRKVAEGGKLDSAAIRSETERLLATNISRFSTYFAGQWLNYRTNLSTADDLLNNMAQESQLVFAEAFGKNNFPTTLLNPGFSYVNQTLATHYGMGTIPTGTNLQKVSSTERGGLLTQGHYLVTTSGSTETNPIKRGIWALDKILCRSLPDLSAATLQEIADAKKSIDPTAPLEDRMRLHRDSSTRCFSCHNQIDPMGLPIESFDHQGKKRTFSMTPLTYNSQPVRDPASLAFAVARSGDFNRCFTRKIKAYVTGSSAVTSNDNLCNKTKASEEAPKGMQDTTVDAIVEEVEKNAN